jgi:hypothetical protein
MALQYTVNVVSSNLFSDAYSYVRLTVTPATGTLPAFYLALPASLANDEHVQAVFTPMVGSQASPVTFDVYFPLFANVNAIDFTIYPQNTDINNITPSTPGYVYRLNTSVKGAGNALLIGFDNKENNVRVLQTFNSPGTDPSPPATYTWTGAKLPSLAPQIAGCVAHVTDFFNGNIFEDISFTNNGQNVPIFQDPSRGGKGHIYFFTNPSGLATLNIKAGNTPSAARFIYHPFAGQTSETARIVIYDPTALGKGFEEATPIKNPFTFTKAPGGDEPVFEINNNNTPPLIQENNDLYILINDKYDSNFQVNSGNLIKFKSTKKFIQTSNAALPAKNDIRYIYVTRDGVVSAARQYAFFCFGDLGEGSTVNFDVVLSWFMESNSEVSPAPRVPKDATGRAQASYNMSTKELSWTITYSGLSGPPTMAHFHGPTSATQTTPPIIDFGTALASPIKGSRILTSAQESELLAGLWYCNIHTQQNTAGEVRGQMWPRSQ